MAILNSNQQPIIGWRSLVVTQVVNAVDADAQAFIAAAGITNLTQAAAVSTLVNDLKTYGLWTKMKALYPMVGGTATSHKFNLKDPRDLDAAYRLVFNGGWTHTSTGALPNGTTGWADTKLIPSVNYNVNNNSHVSFYSRTNSSNSGNNEIGCTNTNVTPFVSNVVTTFRSDQSNKTFLYSNTSNGVSFTDTNSLGFYISNRINTQANGYKNGVSKGSNTVSDEPRASISIVIGANNANTGITQYSSKESAFASIGDGLTDTEATNFYNSVQKYQTSLGRQIGSPIVSDTDAQAFINAAGLTDLGQANAVNTLVVDLKAAGVWIKMKALYPFVGGTATTHKWNLKDPRDLNAAFRLVFTGGWTHTSTGALPNGTNAWANTYFSEYTDITNNDTQLSNLSHASIYSRTNSPSINTYGGIGVDNSQDGYGYFAINLKRADGLSYGAARGTLFTTPTNIADSRGLFLINRQSNSLLKYSRDNSLISQNTTLNTRGASRIAFYLGAMNNWGSAAYFDNKEHSLVSLGYSLTDTEATSFYTAVQKYQTSLGRQIGTPVLPDGQTAGLLETYNGATAAYSLRKLRNGYYGNAIRVRRSSDNAEQDIAFKDDGTLDTVSLLAFVGSGNGFVTTWYDQSGSGNHIIQTTAANQPQIVSSGSVLMENNKPTIVFNQSQTLATTSLSLSFYDCGISYVSRNISGSGAVGVFGYGTNGQSNQTRYLGTYINTLTFIYYGADNQSNISGMGDTTLSIYSLNYQSNTVNFYKNGTTQTKSVFTLSNTTTSRFSINDIFNRGERGNIRFSEGIFYTSGQSSNMNGIRLNQNSYYSIY